MKPGRLVPTSLMRQGFVASRDGVVPLVVEVDEMQWGWVVRFAGTQAELNAAGVADEEMFTVGKSGLKRGDDQFGDPYQTKRRARGRWIVTRHYSNEHAYDRCNPATFADTIKGRAALAAVDSIIEKFKRASLA